MVDRIIEGKNGYIASSDQEMGETALELLSNNQKWMSLHNSTISEIKFYTWANRAEVWVKTFL